MFRLGKFKTSFLYIIFEGLSRGGNSLIFLFAASLLVKTDYINLLALFSLEGLFVIFSPLYYSEVLYKVRDKYNSITVNNSVFLLTIIYLCVLSLIILFFSNFLTNYYSSPLFIFILIAFNSSARIIFQNKSVNNQVDEHHKNAIQDKALPFFASFIFGLIGFLSFEDKIAGFFIGRSIGYFLVIALYFTNIKNNIRITLDIDVSFLRDYFSRTSLLILRGIATWFLGYGILNLLKGWYPVDTNHQIGLILNIWNVFLLIANGINAIYLPAFRKAFLKLDKSENRIYRKITAGYFSILLVSVFVFFVFKIDYLQKVISFLSLESYYNQIPYVLMIYMAQIFQYISMPYFLVYDRFKMLAVIGIATSLISLLMIVFHYYFEIDFLISIVSLFVITYYIRSLPLFLYQKLFLKKI